MGRWSSSDDHAEVLSRMWTASHLSKDYTNLDAPLKVRKVHRSLWRLVAKSGVLKAVVVVVCWAN